MEKRRHIIQTAEVLFAQFGLKKVTVEDIAKAAHVSKATVYKFFKNKGEIFDAVVQAESDELLRLIREAVRAADSTREKLRAHLMTRMDQIHDFANFYRVTQETWGDYWPAIAHVRQNFLAADRDIVREIIDHGIQARELDIKDRDLAAHVMVIGLSTLEYQWAIDEAGISPERLIDLMLDMMIDGIKRRENQ